MILNVDTRRYLARNPRVALRSWDRMRGMIGRDFSQTGFDAMVFHRCRAIHTLFMRCRIDVVFLDRAQTVRAVFRSVAPWRPLVRASGACTVIELPPGAIDESGTAVGHRINLNANLTPETVRVLRAGGELAGAALLRTPTEHVERI